MRLDKRAKSLGLLLGVGVAGGVLASGPLRDAHAGVGTGAEAANFGSYKRRLSSGKSYGIVYFKADNLNTTKVFLDLRDSDGGTLNGRKIDGLKRADVIAGRLNDLRMSSYRLASSLRTWKDPDTKLWVVGVRGSEQHILTCDPEMLESSPRGGEETPQRHAMLLIDQWRPHLVASLGQRPPKVLNVEEHKAMGVKHYDEAVLYDAAGEFDAAREAYQEAITFYPDCILHYESLRDLYATQAENLKKDGGEGWEEKAAGLLKRAADIDGVLPRFREAHGSRIKGDNAWDAGDFGTAARHYEEALGKAPEISNYYIYLAMAYKKQGYDGRAAETLATAAKKLDGTYIVDKILANCKVRALSWEMKDFQLQDNAWVLKE